MTRPPDPAGPGIALRDGTHNLPGRADLRGRLGKEAGAGVRVGQEERLRS